MPLLANRELSTEILRYKFKEPIPAKIQNMVLENLENALNFLASDKPWLSEPENQQHKVLYRELTYAVCAVFWVKDRNPLVWNVKNSPPHWLEELLAYWHNNRCDVITLNYDTLIECVAGSVYSRKRPKIPTGEIYPIRFTQAAINGAIYPESQKVQAPVESFKLFKLHGSVNWYYSGRQDFFGEELFYVPCIGGIDRVFDGIDYTDWLRLDGKRPLIAPPISDKSTFFRHEALHSMWFQAAEAIKNANRIFCLGYSLPESDVTMAQFLRDCAPGNHVQFEIVDLQQKIEHFAKILGKDTYEFRQEYETECCIPRFILHNLIQDSDDKRQVCLEIYERKKRLCASAKTARCS